MAQLFHVVGIDGSSGSRTALRWALADAKTHGHALRAVMCVESGESHRHALTPDSRRTMVAEAQKVLATLVASELGNHAEVEIDLRVALTHGGSVGAALLAEAAAAELLVVGSHGAGWVRSVLLGSVSRWCAEHTRTPLVIVPGGE